MRSNCVCAMISLTVAMFLFSLSVGSASETEAVCQMCSKPLPRSLAGIKLGTSFSRLSKQWKANSVLPKGTRHRLLDQKKFFLEHCDGDIAEWRNFRHGRGNTALLASPVFVVKGETIEATLTKLYIDRETDRLLGVSAVAVRGDGMASDLAPFVRSYSLVFHDDTLIRLVVRFNEYGGTLYKAILEQMLSKFGDCHCSKAVRSFGSVIRYQVFTDGKTSIVFTGRQVILDDMKEITGFVDNMNNLRAIRETMKDKKEQAALKKFFK